MHPPSSMPPPPAPSRPSISARSSATSYHQGRSSRADRHKSASITSDLELDPDADADAEGEVEMADTDTEIEEGDDRMYCLCQQASYGEMIGCDNESCEYEWVSFPLLCLSVERS